MRIPYPSPTPLLTPWGDPLRRGTLAAAVDRDIGFRYPVLSLIPSSEFCSAFCVRAGIARVSVGLPSLYRTFFIIGGGDRSYLRLRGVFAMFFRRICADRDIVPISLCASPFHQICRVKESCKTRSCSRNFKKTGIPYSLNF